MAMVTPNGLLQLTNGMAQSKGHAIHPTPLRFHEHGSNGTRVRSFSASFVFAIRSIAPGVSAQGLTFFVSPTKNFSRAFSNQFLGLLNKKNNGNTSNHIFAVELDTVLNNDMQDINDNHVGIDINDLRSVDSYNAGYYDDKNGTFCNLTLASFDAMQVWVDYNGERKLISVTLAPLHMAKPARALLTTTYDLSQVLKNQSYVGFSSSTGILDTHHYVLGCSFGMNQPAPVIDVKKLPKLPRLGPKPQSKLLIIILPVATATLVLAIVSGIVVLRRRQMRYAELREDWEVEFGPHRFSYKDLFHATEGFKDKHLLGIGGFGRVYKGVLTKSKSEVAVKRVSHESRQGMREFIAEVVSIGRLRHKNIVQLHGYCRRKGELLLVYDHMPNGSLDKYLHNHDNQQNLDWSQRFHIIKGVASGLLYLHEDWEKVVVHRDIKASNVLVDAEMNGRLGDFGLARLYDHGSDPQTTHVVGTMGYIAPELARMGRASVLTDVFAFGMFLLEVTCGRRPIMQSEEQDCPIMLVDLVLLHWRNESLIDVVDKRLQNEYNIDEACLALKLGLLCSHSLPSARPNMRQVMQFLDGDISFPDEVLAQLLSHEGQEHIIVSNFSDANAAQHLGLFNYKNNGNMSNHVFAVEIDTVRNNEFMDIDSNHIGIDISDLRSVNSSSAGYYDDNTGGFQNMSLISGEAIQIWIDYDARAMRIDVALAPFKMAKPTKPLLLMSYNLSMVLTDVAYVGLSAATGPLETSHYILGWSFSMNGSAPSFLTAQLPDLPRRGTDRKGSRRSKVLLIIVPIATATSAVAVSLAVFLFVRRWFKYAELREDWEIDFGPHRFSFKNLYFATEGFKNRHLLGTGGFGRVYKGFLFESKLQIAVKRVSHESRQGIREFIAEILLGYCRRKGELLLVYDYMPNGSLDKYLHCNSTRPSLDWNQRFRIIKGVASGLWYLHGEWEQVVIHRDVKASNVLLDEEMNARLGDFGLARLYDHGTDMQTTHLVGTIGYLAPELANTGKASPATDVFSFGIFVLEVACGRRPIEHGMNSEYKFTLVDWVIDRWHEGSLLEVMDPKLQNGYDDDEACLALKLGLLCSHPSPIARPTMWHVMQYLNHDLPFPELMAMDMVRNQWVDSPIEYCQSVASDGTMSGLSEGR
ncbi:L-type lectin-domain containing receptor kinase SIT2-like [Oryza sativa Japonica Group]|uniref:L-type lectin-domain containing receptor kinase SIT2-like n=1 Tax=Oryza sativa subsp. japonica TaxID=39947 RepID=UPI00339C752B